VLARDGTSRCPAHKVVDGRFADSRRGSRHERGYGSAWDKIRQRILRRDAGICQPCLADGIVHQATHVDHKVNKAEWKRLRGTLVGADDDDNLQAINADCHRLKTAGEAKHARGGGAKTPAPTAPGPDA
jgi:5-methylcytosine-specific restriction protein A